MPQPNAARTTPNPNPEGATSPLIPALIALPSALLPILLPAHLAALLPLLGWTLALQWFIDEYFSFSSFLLLSANTSPNTPHDSTSPSAPNTPAPAHTDTDTDTDALLGQWFRAWLPRGGLCAALSTPLTWSSALLTAFRQLRGDSGTRGAGVWTSLGLALTVYHVYYGNSQYAPFKRIGTAANEGRNGRDMAGWLDMHRTRLWLVDVPAWVCFAAAVVASPRP